MAAYDTGYEEERFEHAVGQTLHCIICANVIKDPVMCRHNEHIFCRACITRHLNNYQTCPSCMDPLTVDTLSQASRTVTNLLAELKIRCEFFDRGCTKFIELGDLEMHVKECGFAPAVCSNKGCQITVNKRDLLHHETADCERRRVQCHSCDEIRREMDTVKVNLTVLNERMNRNREHWEKNEAMFENAKAVVENVVGKAEAIQEKLENQEVKMRHVQGDIEEIKKSLYEIATQLERIAQQKSHGVHAEQDEMKKNIAEAADMDREPEIFVFGGWTDYDTPVRGVKIFNLSKRTWTSSSCGRGGSPIPVVSQNQIMLVGGQDPVYNDETSSIVKLSINSDDPYRDITMEDFHAFVPYTLSTCGYHCEVYKERLMVIGRVNDYVKQTMTHQIIEVSLIPPYTNKLLATLPRGEEIYGYGVASIHDKIVIIGGKGCKLHSAIRNVVTYDITKNQWEELAPLPYPVNGMTIVKWGNDNIIILGGVGINHERLSTVLMYNVNTQKSYMLPNMKYKRERCVAAVVKDTVVVIGGHSDKEFYLQAVEGFRFDRYTWEELPSIKLKDISGYTAIAW